MRKAVEARYAALFGVGGIGTGVFYALDGDQTLGRSESRSGRKLDVRDYCKLHILCHYFAVLTGAGLAEEDVKVVPIGKVGGDEAGLRLRQELAQAGADLSYVDVVPGKPTLSSVCFQYPDGAGCNITACNSAAELLSTGDIDRCEKTLARYGSRAIAVAAPEVAMQNRTHLLALATRHHALRAASLTRAEVAVAREEGLLESIDLLALNDEEAEVLAGMPLDPDDPDAFLRSCIERLLEIQPAIRVVISAGKHGAFGWDQGQWMRSRAPRAEVASTAGAGDALLAGVLAGLAAGMPFLKAEAGPERVSLASALDLGVLLGSFSVQSPHSIHPDADAGRLFDFGLAAGLPEAELEEWLVPRAEGGAAIN